MYFLFAMIWCLLGFLPGYVASSCYNPPSDLCSNKFIEMPKLVSRDPSIIFTNKTSHWKFCDVYAIDTNKWYKSESPMTSHCPSMYMCGTKFPIWMNGQNPRQEEGLVNRTSCIRHFESCCFRTYRLSAVNCGQFMAYCFVHLPTSCHQRYCFDNDFTTTSRPTQISTLTAMNTVKFSGTSISQKSTYVSYIEEKQTSTTAASTCFDTSSDICLLEMSEVPNLESRSPSYTINIVTSNLKFCDMYEIHANKWYRSQSPMSTSCPSMYMCGTKFPIWMYGQNPKPEDGLVNRTSCLRNFDNSCLTTYRVSAVNCGWFMAYCFIDLPSGCPQRYCFDNVLMSTTTPPHTSILTDKNSRSSNTNAHKVSDESQTPFVLSDKELLTITVALIGLMTATVIGLLTLIIRRKSVPMMNDKIGKINIDTDPLKQPVHTFINDDDAGHMYETIQCDKTVPLEQSNDKPKESEYLTPAFGL
ncbi:uncharacterized protein LOC132729064 isoform X2 [Ruditapes philippinarum]|uniref:uncharacterized protein LOC132729064 isoform X2 n=1 Tax=Ruditapes philippinarum TaxID=129788 RepID=UPI00295BABD7|nr:uncharacterized protein LOC132729064 isoform X2 [Ruditapes philippinarum]